MIPLLCFSCLANFFANTFFISRENQFHPFYRIYSIFPRKSAPSFPMSNIPLYKGVFKSFPEKNDVFFRVFFEFFNIFHVISMILNEHDLLLHDISQLYLLCWLISIEISSIIFIAYIPFSQENQLHPFYRIYSIFPRKSAPSFLSHIFHFPKKISSILFIAYIPFFQENQLHPFPMSNLPLYKGVFKSFPEKNDVFLEFFLSFLTSFMLYQWFRMSMICFSTIFHNCICSAISSLLKSRQLFLMSKTPLSKVFLTHLLKIFWHFFIFFRENFSFCMAALVHHQKSCNKLVLFQPHFPDPFIYFRYCRCP